MPLPIIASSRASVFFGLADMFLTLMYPLQQGSLHHLLTIVTSMMGTDYFISITGIDITMPMQFVTSCKNDVTCSTYKFQL